MQNLGQERRNALIIGGSTGIGKAISLKLAEIGCNLLIHGGTDAKALDQTCAEARAFGISADGFLHKFNGIADFMGRLPTEYIPDIMVIAFGPIFEGSLAATSVDAWQYLVEANLGLPGALISYYGPKMAERRFGRIILFGGTNTDQLRGFREVAAYSSAKTGLGVLAKSAAKEFGARNVTCNVVCPGYVSTDKLKGEMRVLATRRMPSNLLQSTENMAEIVVSVIRSGESGLNGAILSCAHGM